MSDQCGHSYVKLYVTFPDGEATGIPDRLQVLCEKEYLLGTDIVLQGCGKFLTMEELKAAGMGQAYCETNGQRLYVTG